ncbi:sigma-70 family RNA polymerase sigma factor [bacterium]|nr:sigma-70 family RNA polymerase sigma factor [bacterium]
MFPADEDLVIQYVEKGDEKAFRILIDRHQERVFGYLLGMVRDRETANDLFQETFLKVISALSNERGSYTVQGKFLGWVLRIARNAALDYLRSRKKWTDVSSSYAEDDVDYWDRLPDESPSADLLVHRSEQADVLKMCIDALPAEQREVLLLRHEADMTFKEIADLTGCSINTALGRMRYALINLRRQLTAQSKMDLTEVAQS